MPDSVRNEVANDEAELCSVPNDGRRRTLRRFDHFKLEVLLLCVLAMYGDGVFDGRLEFEGIVESELVAFFRPSEVLYALQQSVPLLADRNSDAPASR